MAESKPSIDEATMTVPQLNDFVISLLKPIRSARVRIIRHLSNKLKKLRASKKPGDLVERKVNNMLEEIKHIKALKLDNNVIKSLLAKEVTEKDLSKAATPSDRATLRLAVQKSHFTEAVAKFRKEHEDWRSLTDFMLSKHGGRRFRKRNAKVSSEKLAKATLDVADKRAREQFVNNDQRHQHNKRPAAMKPQDDRRVAEGALLPTDMSDEGADNEHTEKPKKQEAAGTTWLSSIFSVTKTETEIAENNCRDNDDSPTEAKSVVASADNEAVVYKIDPDFFKKPNEAAMLPMPTNSSIVKKKVANITTDITVSAEAPGEDFFMEISGEDKDEVSRAVGNSLPFDHFEDQPSRFNRRNPNSQRGFGRGGNREFAGRGGFSRGDRPAYNQDRQSRPNDRQSAGYHSSGVPKKDDKLHASWEARRQQRQQQQIHISGNAAPQKRVVFSDD